MIDKRKQSLPPPKTGAPSRDYAKKEARGKQPRRGVGANYKKWLVALLLVLSAVLGISLFVVTTESDYYYFYYPDEPPLTLKRPPPRLMSETRNNVYFLHIGKAGGSSVDKLMGKILRRRGRKYEGYKHYDWSWVEQRGDPDADADVITFLREPVSRAVSQFYFSKSLRWAQKRNATLVHQTLDEYLANPGRWRQPINDGAGGVTFLAGTARANGWIASDGLETYFKEYLRNNTAAHARHAASNLDRTVYFGLLEDIPRSMEMLQMTLDLETVPVFPSENRAGQQKEKPRSLPVFPSENRAGGGQKKEQPKRGNNNNKGDDHQRRQSRDNSAASSNKRNISAATAAAIESYIPGDLWFYQYAKLLFEARWNYLTGETEHYEHPRLPPLPESLRGGP